MRHCHIEITESISAWCCSHMQSRFSIFASLSHMFLTASLQLNGWPRPPFLPQHVLIYVTAPVSEYESHCLTAAIFRHFLPAQVSAAPAFQPDYECRHFYFFQCWFLLLAFSSSRLASSESSSASYYRALPSSSAYSSFISIVHLSSLFSFFKPFSSSLHFSREAHSFFPLLLEQWPSSSFSYSFLIESFLFSRGQSSVFSMGQIEFSAFLWLHAIFITQLLLIYFHCPAHWQKSWDAITDFLLAHRELLSQAELTAVRFLPILLRAAASSPLLHDTSVSFSATGMALQPLSYICASEWHQNRLVRLSLHVARAQPL